MSGVSWLFYLLIGNVSNTYFPGSWQLKCFWSPHQSHSQSLFLNEWGENIESEFCNNIENKVTGGILCFIHSVGLHTYLRSQILLIFDKQQVIHSAFCILPCVEVAWPIEPGWGGRGLAALVPPLFQIFAVVDLLPIDNDSEKKKGIVKIYKPLQIPRTLLVTLLLSTTCNAYR